MAAKRKWTDEQLVNAVSKSRSVAELRRILGTPGNNYEHLYIHIRRLGIDISHFYGQGWAKGIRIPEKNAIPLEKVLIQGRSTSSHNLKLRLIRLGIKKHQCEICLLTKWRNKPIPIQLDHINGDKSDNRLNNLRILCANCHAQTDTYCGKNKISSGGGIRKTRTA